MGSSEIVDSGRSSAVRSNFSQTCNRLSQYLKENGSFADLSLGLAHNKETPIGTRNLLPMIGKSGQNSASRCPNPPLKTFPQFFAGAGRDETQKKSDISGMKSEAETAQMTIFYAGQVIVFNDFSAEKAKEIMALARNSCGGAVQNHHTAAAPVPSPQARKRSVARFLEKRKDRVTANAPYQASKPTASQPLKPVKAEPWLGLAPLFSHQMQRH